MSRKVRFLAKFTDSKGIGHVAIHSYDRLTGFVDMMKDFKFEGFQYPCTDLEAERYQKEHEKWLEEHKRFKVVRNASDSSMYKILDTKKNISIATFFDKSEAEDFAEYKNGNEKYLD